MKIEKVELDQSKHFWLIYSSCWDVYVQRRGPVANSDPPLDFHERVICALCESFSNPTPEKP